MPIKQTTVITCECGSEDVSFKKRFYNEEYKTVGDSSLDHFSTICVSAKIVFDCTCQKCGKCFEEEGGYYKRDRLPGEFYKY